MTFAGRRMMVRYHLEAAMRLQRDSWDEALAAQEAAGDSGPDIYAVVAELAGGLRDDEPIPDDVVDSLLFPRSCIESSSLLQ